MIHMPTVQEPQRVRLVQQPPDGFGLRKVVLTDGACRLVRLEQVGCIWESREIPGSGRSSGLYLRLGIVG